MAPRKKADDKSPQLAAAAVGQSAELVQTQAEPLQSVALEQSAEAQGVDLVAEQAAKQAEMLAAEEARQANGKPVTEQEVHQLATDITLKALGLEPVQQQQASADWLLGQFDVKAKSQAGFWRCGVHFLHSGATRVFVVTAKADVPHDHDCEIPCCYLTPTEAQRVHQESWLTVVPGSEVTKD
ncbi:hypothetical protein [Aeromonas sp. QDB03]|uniref:hypothetical protein n=1 Tax=Aeromonas sp. QDB03 TaxID=2989839 RepID=UPI0022DE9BBE|nr:hypothetical protein [Aeromonas sp. QDB03]